MCSLTRARFRFVVEAERINFEDQGEIKPSAIVTGVL